MRKNTTNTASSSPWIAHTAACAEEIQNIRRAKAQAPSNPDSKYQQEWEAYLRYQLLEEERRQSDRLYLAQYDFPPHLIPFPGQRSPLPKAMAMQIDSQSEAGSQPKSGLPTTPQK